MKKLLLSILTVVGISFVNFSQDGIVIKVAGDNSTDYSSGHAPYQVNTSEANDIPVDLEVYNNTANDLNLEVKIVRNDGTPLSWTNAYCFGIECYPSPTSFPYCNPNRTLSITAGQHAQLIFHIEMPEVGNGGYKLILGPDCNTALDSVLINGSFSLASLKETKQVPTFSMHPNPANDLVTINTNSNEKASLKIVDLLGNVVFTDSFIGSTSVNTNDFKNGVYFVTTEVNGMRYSNRKLIIRH